VYVAKVCDDESHEKRLVSKAELSLFLTVKMKSVGPDAEVSVELTDESKTVCAFLVASIT